MITKPLTIILLLTISHFEKTICVYPSTSKEAQPTIPNEPLTEEKALETLRQYFPETELEELLKERSIFEDDVIAFNKYIANNQKEINFRQFHGLADYKCYGFEYLNGRKSNEYPLRAYEIANALITVGERFKHNVVTDINSVSGSSKSAGNNCFKTATIWRGEVREKEEVDVYLQKMEYRNGDRFVSFSKVEERAMGFLSFNHYVPSKSVRVLYEFKVKKKIFHLDFSKLKCDLDIEKEVIIYPNMKFKITKYQNKRDPESWKKFLHITMENEADLDELEWKMNNYCVLQKYWRKAQESSSFRSKGPEPKHPFSGASRKLRPRCISV